MIFKSALFIGNSPNKNITDPFFFLSIYFCVKKAVFNNYYCQYKCQ